MLVSHGQGGWKGGLNEGKRGDEGWLSDYKESLELIISLDDIYIMMSVCLFVCNEKSSLFLEIFF